MESRQNFQLGGLKWLYEMEMIQDPQLINNLKFNILALSPHIKEVEFLSIYETRQLLIWIELNWWGKLFYKKQLLIEVSELVAQLLPKFKTRVTIDYSILELSRQKIIKALSGGKNEKNSNSDSSNGRNSSNS